jgi:putative flippase GtrA
VNALWQRFGHLVRELGKFGVVGGLAYAIDVTFFNVFLSSLGGIGAKISSTVIAASAAFIGNRFWTWRDRERSGLRREYLLYFFFNAVGLGIALACLWLSHSGLGHFWPRVYHTRLADNIAAQGFGLVLGTTFRFWSYKRFVFVAASTDKAAAELAEEPVAHP